VCSLARPRAGRLGFLTNRARLTEDATEAGVVLLAPPDLQPDLAGTAILVDDPKLAFAQALGRFFAPQRTVGIAPTARIDPSAVLGEGVVIGEYCVVGPLAQIGDHTELRHHVVIGPGVRIGRHCLIKSNTVIGEEGFGFSISKTGEHLRIDHIGSAIIGDHVEIGALNTVCSGTIDPTEVHDHVKTDDHVHIAHNCIVGRGSLLTASSELSGSVILGERVWLGPGSSVMDGITIGNDVVVGLGAAVTKSVAEGLTVMGVPARTASEIRRLQTFVKQPASE
jgi:UDP-3-O-[3-hydroxymyristoyl] glucosamine N-acyltransferase